VDPLNDVRQISNLAYGFIASKTLFAALNLDLFSRLSPRARTLTELTGEIGIPRHRLLTLLTACVSLGLLSEIDGQYANAPASEAYLVRQAPAYFGDYFRFQVDRQIYPLLSGLDQALQGCAPRSLYGQMNDPEVAESFTRAQHAGSLGPASLLQKAVELSQARRMLDVAGGSGAFTITLCRRHPQLRATILDFPAVIEVAKRFVSEAGLEDRVDCIGGNAVTQEWPGSQDVVLMSYLLSGVAGSAIGGLLAQAFRALEAGGLLLVHDFMVDDDRSGPQNAALWFMTFLFDPEAISFTPSDLVVLAEGAGFVDARVRDLIPGITRLLMARKPS
jgi:2-hydroxy-4-(methylsulfanyl)butanoate S-methyltransferase